MVVYIIGNYKMEQIKKRQCNAYTIVCLFFAMNNSCQNYLFNSARIFTCHRVICFVLLAIFLVPLSHAGTKFVIETDQPEDFFVVSCTWSSDFLVLHGGRKKTKEKIFITSSGKEIDCGWSLFGKGPSIDVMHPLYVSVNACAYGPECNSKYSSYTNGRIIVKPVPIEQFLSAAKTKYKNEELYNYIRGFCAAHFGDYYFKKYNSVSRIDIYRFKKAYSDRLKQFWKRAATIGHFPKVSSNADSAIHAYFLKSNARFKR